ncbi:MULTISPECIES: ABC transporter permease [unclassified Achromobacter]|jgi:peptide/nickel transport system permease protein|uniref:ABC transporter permease n=1 Tax=unclassified Achromobacter TaxID=2626865 RepID=UPI000B519AC8|nr:MULTISPECIES: ABC transporter permease [unclassified Achromobacter]OWT75551.1 peptide ABC transporter permease [Achromobacter sp. HZ28]OWT76212.1 peptide ABC transporter permease [Achromobacter sp. HZ34]
MQTILPNEAARRAAARRRFRSLEFVLGVVLTAVMVLAVLLSGWLFPDGGEAMDLGARLIAPFQSWAHVFGTDPLGRDVLARVVVGGQISLTAGFFSVLFGALLGTVMGLVSGYYRGVWDVIVMRFADVQLALPFILVAITFISILGGGLFNVIFFMVISQWVQYARLVRAQVLALREREFVQAARAFGVRDLAMLRHHIVPNLLGPLIILMALNVANNILLESSLTFLGLGVDPTIPSWGGMLADGRTYLQTAWWVSVFPGLAIMLTVLGLNLLGDWLRDRLDPTGKV